METSVIEIPKGFKIKEVKENKIILEEKEEKLTYEKVARKLFIKDFFYIDGSGRLIKSTTDPLDFTNVTSIRQGKKLLAINKLMNVAKYLNGGWQPNWNDREENKYYITVHDNIIVVQSVTVLKCMDIYFKSEELAEQAIEILSKETIKLAFCTDY